MTALTTDDAPHVPVRPTKLIAYSTGHRLPWLDQNNEFTADALALTSKNKQVFPAIITTGGSAHAGDTVGVRLYFDGANHDFTYTVQSGDTLLAINTALVNAISADSSIEALNIFAFFQSSTATLTWYIIGPSDKMPVVSQIGTTAYTNFSITQSSGVLDIDSIGLHLQRVAEGHTPKVGDHLFAVFFNGQTSGSGNGIGANYVQLLANILDPANGLGRFSIATQQGVVTLDEGGVNCSGPPGYGLKVNGEQLTSAAGSWTPGVRGSGNAGSPIYAAQAGSFRKRGKEVFVQGFIQTTSLTGATGYTQFTGLPYPVRQINGIATIGYYSGITLPNGYTHLGLISDINATTLTLFASGSGVGVQALPIGNVGALNIRFNMRYETD